MARPKPNGHLVDRSPLSSVVELEMLRLGVEGKAAGWRTLRALADRDSRLDKERLNELISRAHRQSDTLEELHVLASSKALHTARTSLAARRSEDPAGTPPMCLRPVNHGDGGLRHGPFRLPSCACAPVRCLRSPTSAARRISDR